jgi:hypothetical protein
MARGLIQSLYISLHVVGSSVASLRRKGIDASDRPDHAGKLNFLAFGLLTHAFMNACMHGQDTLRYGCLPYRADLGRNGTG